MQSQSNLGRLAWKTVGLFLLTALIASAIGLAVGTFMDLTPSVELTAAEVVGARHPTGFTSSTERHSNESICCIG